MKIRQFVSLAVLLAVYLVLKIEDINGMKLWAYVFTPNFEGVMYWAEIGLGVVTPMLLLFNTRVRTNPRGIFLAALLVVLGFVFNRLNIAITAVERSSGTNYFPSLPEISITLMIVALGFAVFRLAVRYLPIFPHRHEPVADAPHDVVAFIQMPSHDAVNEYANVREQNHE